MRTEPTAAPASTALPDTEIFLPFMRDVSRCEQSLQELNLMWRIIESSAKMNCPTEAKTILPTMAATRAGFAKLEQELVVSLVQEKVRNVMAGIGTKAQYVIDIVVRNLFERTADIGFLATDSAIVDACVANDPAVFAALRERQWHDVIDVSLHGFFNVTQPLTLPMIRTRWGRVINISSVSALAGNRGQVNYAAAKGALNSATRALALELASRGITVNAVAPGIIDTGMAEQAFDAAAIERLVPMKRAGRAQEVAATSAVAQRLGA